MSKLWFDIHRDECVADTWKMVGQSAELRKLYEKEQRQRAKLNNSVHQEPCSDKTISVQKSCSEEGANPSNPQTTKVAGADD